MQGTSLSGAPETAKAVLSRTPLDERLHTVQLGLSVDGIRDTALSSPVWAAVMAGLFGGIVPDLGRTPFARSWPWVVLCAITGAAVFFLWRVVKTKAADEKLQGRFWRPLVASAYFSVAASWCLITPIFWEPDNIANHCFLLLVTISAVCLFLTARSGDFLMVVAATIPNIGIAWIYFLRHDVWFDMVIAILLPLWAIQLHLDSWRGCRTVALAHRTRLEMEILAAELKVATDEAARANRAKSLFLANMSHELRTPLNAILGFSEVILTEALGKNAPRYRDYVADIARSGRHLLGLIDDVLDIAKIEAEKLELDREWLDGETLVEECVTIVAGRAERAGIALISSVSPSGLRVFADARAFRQIVLNLLSNAVKFTPSQGLVEVALEPAKGGAMLTVTDSGRGIPEDQLARLFQPFEQLDNRYGRANGGTGLGLALVRSLSELHGGNCRIESEVGKGTAVSVFLPNTSTLVADPRATAAA
jgi:two-component system cell cycle sensor histidine kinase PleC